MMKLGEWQKLQVVRVLPIGAYLADPQEIAEVITFIASDKASYITGSVVDVNGGMRL